MLFKTATARNMFSLVACGLATTTLAAGILFSMAYRDARQSALAELDNVATNNAQEIAEFLKGGFNTVGNMRSVISAMKENGIATRANADATLHQILTDTPYALGVWTGWDPNAFDGKDANFAGKPEHDATGRYVPYW